MSQFFAWWPKDWSFSFSINPSNENSGLISFRTDWFNLLAVQGTPKSLLQHHNSKASILLHSAGDIRNMGSTPGLENPLEKEMATHPVLLPGKSHGQRSLVGYSSWGHKESNTTEWRSMSRVYGNVAKTIIWLLILLYCEEACFAIYLFVPTIHTKYILD